jgi:hypothetical protein
MQSGVYRLKNALQALPALPGKRTALGRALQEWRDGLIADLGGEDRISTQQRALVDLAVRSKLLVDSVDGFILTMPNAVNKKKRCLHPVVKERSALVGQLQSLLRDLGLERRLDDTQDVAAVLAALHAPREGGEGGIPLREKRIEHSNTPNEGCPQAPTQTQGDT